MSRFAQLSRFRITGPQTLIMLVGLWVLTVGNVPLWSRVLGLGAWTAALCLLAVLWLFWVALFQGLAWPWLLRGALALAVPVSAANSHFMLTYGVVIDPSMMASVLATDAREVRDLLSWRLVLTVVVLALPALWLIVRARPVWPPLGRGLLQRVGIALAALVALLLVGWLGYADLASLMRNQREVRYQISPFNTVYGLARLAQREEPGAPKVLIPVGEDARLATAKAGPPPLLMVVVGETARAANFGLGGYARDTTPRLAAWQAQGDLVYWRQATACGTNTHVSVPCMFSPLTGDEGGAEPARHENLLDVLQRAGLAVLWVDNQSGCKGVCERVPHAQVADRPDPRWCDGGECLDEALVQGLDERIEALDPARRARGVVLVLHQMGNHGPAYFKRSPADRKPFQPECNNVTLAECQPETLRNAYDNAIAYTDHVLDLALQWLQAREREGRYATGLIYASDHGESLGEGGLYLHGAPRLLAPREQLHVPMLAWYSPALRQRLGLDVACLRQRADQPVSHDHLFHTVLGAMEVQTSAHQSTLDWHTPCRQP